jgi:hypothetical protein
LSPTSSDDLETKQSSHPELNLASYSPLPDMALQLVTTSSTISAAHYAYIPHLTTLPPLSPHAPFNPSSYSSSLHEAQVDDGLPWACSPFRELPAGPASFLFWTALGVGKDSYMFQNFGVYPFDRLNDTERIIILTEVNLVSFPALRILILIFVSFLLFFFCFPFAKQVAEAMSGYKSDLKPNILNESALYAVFALMKARIKKELEDAQKDEETDTNFLWRKRVLEAYEQVYQTNAAAAGLSIECWKRSVWNTVINLLARSLFGDSFWEKKKMFLTPNALQRIFMLKHYKVPSGYFICRLPSTVSTEIQLTFKKLITMSKTFLCDEPVRPSGCFCQDCIAELEVPLTFKLQFLEEAAEEKRKNKKGRKSRIEKRVETLKEEESNRRKLDELVLSHRKELKGFWSSMAIEEKWCLTEMTSADLSDITALSPHWGRLRFCLFPFYSFFLCFAFLCVFFFVFSFFLTFFFLVLPLYRNITRCAGELRQICLGRRCFGDHRGLCHHR